MNKKDGAANPVSDFVKQLQPELSNFLGDGQKVINASYLVIIRDLFAAAAMIANPNDSWEQHFTDADGMMRARGK